MQFSSAMLLIEFIQSWFHLRLSTRSSSEDDENDNNDDGNDDKDTDKNDDNEVEGCLKFFLLEAHTNMNAS